MRYGIVFVSFVCLGAFVIEPYIDTKAYIFSMGVVFGVIVVAVDWNYD